MSTTTTTLARSSSTPPKLTRRSIASPAEIDRLPGITYSQLQEHSGGDHLTAWTAIDGIVYDITEFSKSHPGGAIIRYAAGRDATCLYESYHAFSNNSRVDASLSRCTKVGKLIDGPVGSTLNDLPDSSFFRTVTERVRKHVDDNKINIRQYDTIYAIESIVTLLCYLIGTYYVSFHGSWIACILLGVVTGRMGFIMHSGGHCGTSKTVWFNRFTAHFMDLIGSSTMIWGYEHQVAHHMDPNEYHKDNDCEIGNPYVRMHPDIPHNNWHSWQHITVPIGMTVGLLKWYAGDFASYFASQVGNVKMTITKVDWIKMWIFKAAWLIIHVIIPSYLFGVGKAFVQLLIFMGIGGHYLENTFIVNHIQAGHVPPASAHWANKQVLSTSNWQSASVLWNWISGGLNHQIEHHLFPAISIYMYPALSDIVRTTCREYNLPYHNYPTFTTAWMDMWNYLRALGKKNYRPEHFVSQLKMD